MHPDHEDPNLRESTRYQIPALHRLSFPILSGPMRGMRWLPFSGGKLLRLMLGTYEADQSALMRDLLQPGNVFFDVGAAVGYYTVLASPLVGTRGRVISFEPDPKNAAFLRRHVEVNRLTNVVTHQAAVGNTNGEARFTGGSGSGTGRLADSGTISVAICRLDDLIPRIGVPTHMKIDVEGAEVDVLRGATQMLQHARPTLFLSTHGPNVHRACVDFLKELGYQIRPISSDPKYAAEVLCTPKQLAVQSVLRRAG